jgi:hypothetical protein
MRGNIHVDDDGPEYASDSRTSKVCQIEVTQTCFLNWVIDLLCMQECNLDLKPGNVLAPPENRDSVTGCEAPSCKVVEESDFYGDCPSYA